MEQVKVGHEHGRIDAHWDATGLVEKALTKARRNFLRAIPLRPLHAANQTSKISYPCNRNPTGPTSCHALNAGHNPHT
jgi:hypothetical protein